MAFRYSPKIVTDGLVLYLDASNLKSIISGSTVWNDISRGGNNGILTNGPLYNSSNSGNIVFDGVDDYVDLGTASFFNGLINITVSVWVNPQSTDSYIFSRYYNHTINGFILYHNSNNKFGFDGRESSDAYLSVVSTNSFSKNNWHNVVATKSGNIWSIYVNGVLENSGVRGIGNIGWSNNRCRISSLDLNSPNIFYSQNKIANVKVYNRALSAAEVLQNYNATKGRYL